ncbi:P-loop containing nucleoside triphosphate hydrolase protein [Lentinus tigrinus ALCF2SS1-6]|uniref:P-loop containing nucleoside triphosphate hydrolase protein n=1 Tax=Lentinus tigrinus ALCF2SS1-6 TaxID=1328759 RepID=A0A5C2S763_9APHY|nr:P-loop containing nucleoside triphosphate hydrolase protein [Lentinus tigrinus ALCF2SS1-6]
MRIQQLVPPLSADLAQALQEIGIKTDTDLLLAHDPLTIFAKLPAGHGVSLRQFRDALAQVAELASAPVAYGDKLFEQEMKRQEDIYVEDMLLGVPEVDALLGGFNPPRVIELSGDAGSGKTALALQVALRHLTRTANSSVLWIDTGGEFSPERVALLVEKLEGPYSTTALERLQVSLAFDIEAAHEVLEAVRQALSAAADSDAAGEVYDSASASPVTRCIVVDSITSLLGPMLSATSSQGHAIMTTFMRQLRAFADSFSLTILVINTSTKVGPRNTYVANPEAVFETGRKPGLGPSFTFMTDTTLWLTRRSRDEQEGDADSTVHTAEVFRSRITRSKTWAPFRIRNGLLVSA